MKWGGVVGNGAGALRPKGFPVIKICLQSVSIIHLLSDDEVSERRSDCRQKQWKGALSPVLLHETEFHV